MISCKYNNSFLTPLHYAKGINFSWSTIRDTTQTQVRVTMAAKCKDGQILYLRKSSVPNEKQTEILDALKINHKAGATTKIYK